MKRLIGSRHSRDAMQQLPFIMFLDIDKTLIGQAHAASHRFWLHAAVRELAEAGVLPRGAGARLPVLDPAAEMAPLLRPGVAEGLRRIRRALPGAELFVCSAGTRALVHGLKVPGIERACGLKFNRPVFCASTDPRENCRSVAFGHLKLVRACFDRAALSLRRKYPALRDAAAREAVFDTRFFMVDDTASVALDAPSNKRLIQCPPYEVRPWADPFEGVPRTILTHPLVMEYVRAQILPAPSSVPAPGSAAAFLKACAQYCDAEAAKAKEQREHAPDTFWERLADMVEQGRLGHADP